MSHVRRAHKFEIRLCSDPSCDQVHLVLCDKERPFAEFLFDSESASAFDFIGVLIDACRDAQMRARERADGPALH